MHSSNDLNQYFAQPFLPSWNPDYLINEYYKKLKTDTFEGATPWTYMDKNGNMTIGVGHLITDPTALQRLNLYNDPNGNHLATPKNYDECWKTMHEFKPPKGYIHNSAGNYLKYKQYKILYMTEKQMRLDAFKLIRERISNMLKMFPNITSAPFPAQMAVLDMMYNVDMTKLRSKFPMFDIAVTMQDWCLAAINCHRTKIQEERNRIVAKWFIAAQTAAHLKQCTFSFLSNKRPSQAIIKSQKNT